MAATQHPVQNPFKRAEKSASFLRMALAGPSGSGKTMTSLLIATGLATGRSIAVIDTERGSASKYADQFAFDVLELDSFHPERYIEAIEAAAAAGYTVLIIDSLSHAWNGSGGALELHDQAVRRQKTQNSYTAWADITPLQNRLISAITGAPLHVIATMRAKTEYVQDKNERGGTTIRKVGMAPIQREGMEYEYDIFGQLDLEHNLVIEKSRCPALANAVIGRPDARLADTLNAWLRGIPAPTQPTQPAQQTRAASATTPATTASAPLTHVAAPAPEADLQLASEIEQRNVAKLLRESRMNTGEVRALVTEVLQRPTHHPLNLERLKAGMSDLTKTEFRALFNRLSSDATAAGAPADVTGAGR